MGPGRSVANHGNTGPQFRLRYQNASSFKEHPAAAKRQLSTLTKRAEGPELHVCLAF